jgi:hypothetical protein
MIESGNKDEDQMEFFIPSTFYHDWIAVQHWHAFITSVGWRLYIPVLYLLHVFGRVQLTGDIYGDVCLCSTISPLCNALVFMTYIHM